MRAIFFSHTDLQSADHCREEIVRHLRQALDGAVDSPVAASIDLQRLQAGNTVERSIAELVTGFSALEKELHGVRNVLRHTFFEISRQDRDDRFFDAWYYNAARQRTIVTHLVDEVSKLVRVAQKYYKDDPELEKALFDAQGACLGLRLSFLVSTPELKGWAADEGIQAAEEIRRALTATNDRTSADGGDQPSIAE